MCRCSVVERCGDRLAAGALGIGQNAMSILLGTVVVSIIQGALGGLSP